jgi:hypothetical protein
MTSLTMSKKRFFFKKAKMSLSTKAYNELNSHGIGMGMGLGMGVGMGMGMGMGKGNGNGLQMV